MLRLRAKSIGSYARSLLAEPRSFGRVEHVFTNTLYLRLGQDDMVVVTAYPSRSLFAVNVYADDYPSREGFTAYVRPMSSVRFDEEQLIIGEGLTVDVSSAEVYKGLGIQAGAKVPEEALTRRAYLLLHLSGFLASALRSPSSRAVNARICETIGKGRSFDEEAARSLVGLGEGFTPSGDDFYVGLASTLSFACLKLRIYEACERLHRLRIALEDPLSLTTWASRVYIRYALSGMLDEAMERLLLNFYTEESADGLLDSALGLARRGHESGVFLLTGATVALAELHALKEVWRERLCNYIT